MKPIYQIFLILFIIQSAVFAQTPDSIIFVPDRPGMAIPPDILTFEKLQLETCLQFEHYNDGTALNENYHVPTVLLRLGLLKNAEARISTDYLINIETDSGVSSSISGMNPITIGTKVKVFKQRTILPKTSLLINLTLPWYGKTEFTPLYLAPSIYLLMSNSVFGRMNICYNYGLIWDGNHSPLTQIYALCLGFSLSKNLSIFAEGYGNTSKYKRANLYYNGGFAFLINDHFQIDVSASGQYKSDNDYYLVNIGIAWQVAGKKMKF